MKILAALLCLGTWTSSAAPQEFWSPDRATLKREGGSGTIEPVRQSIDWLLMHQAGDGRFSADFIKACAKHGGTACTGTGQASHDAGTTGLALLVLTATGSTMEIGEFREAIQRGVRWLLSKQDKQGVIGQKVTRDFLYSHSIGTYALCEALRDVVDVDLRAKTQRALDVLEKARNPLGAWRYDLPPIGDNDTSVSAWAISALMAGARSGFDVDKSAIEGGLTWIEATTVNGRTGYDRPGNASARTPTNQNYARDIAEAMTAAGLWARLRTGQSPDWTSHAQSIELILEKLPSWREDVPANDMYYWYYGTLCMFQVGGKAWKKWNLAFRQAVLDWQSNEGGATGSWDPVGPWGYTGGRMYSTAMMALSLEVYYRYPRFGDSADRGLDLSLREELNAKPRLLTDSTLVLTKRLVRFESYDWRGPGSKRLELRYSLNGTDPGPGARVYKKPIQVKGGAQLSVQAYLDGAAVGEPSWLNFTKAKPLPASKLKKTAPGLALEIYAGNWHELPDLSERNPDQTSVANKLSVSKGLNGACFIWTGFIYIPRTEVYRFRTNKRSALRLSIGSVEVLWPEVEDEQHATPAGDIALAKGWHELDFRCLKVTGRSRELLSYAILGEPLLPPTEEQLGRRRR